MILHVITERPSDFPRHYVVRQWLIEPGSMRPRRIGCLFDSLEAARASMPAGAVCMARQPGDDPVIVESWL